MASEYGQQYGQMYFHFYRGFPERALHLEFTDFLRWDERVWQVAPVNYVQFTDWHAESGDYWAPEEKEQTFRALAAKPELARLRALILLDSIITIRDLETFFASPYLAGVRTLAMAGVGYDFDADGAGGRTPDHNQRMLTCVARLPAVTYLNLEDNRINAEEVGRMLDSPWMERLIDLGLGNNDLGDEGAERLASSLRVSKLSFLTLPCNRITDQGAHVLAASPHLDNLKQLTLTANDISPATQAELREKFGDRVQF